jgi:multidrug efflux pump subunit AcrA (membrane-fusion protein)
MARCWLFDAVLEIREEQKRDRANRGFLMNAAFDLVTGPGGGEGGIDLWMRLFQKCVAAPHVAAAKAALEATRRDLQAKDAELQATKDAEAQSLAAKDAELLAAKSAEANALAAVDASQRKVQELEEATKCAICLDAPRSQRLEPCGHNCLCAACTQGLQHCPICRTPISSSSRTFS